MRATALLLGLAALGAAGCFVEPDDAAAPAVPAADARAAAETRALVDAALAARDSGALDAAAADRAARALGATDAVELAALAARECLDSRDVMRFAAARGLSSEDAAATLKTLGVKVCSRVNR